MANDTRKLNQLALFEEAISYVAIGFLYDVLAAVVIDLCLHMLCRR